MRNRKKKGPTGDKGHKPEPTSNETLSPTSNETLSPEAKEETKDAPVKEISKSKPSRLRRCARFCIKLILFLAVLAVLFVLFMMFALPRILSEIQVVIYLIWKGFHCHIKSYR